VAVVDPQPHDLNGTSGTSLLPPDLSEDEFAAMPILESVEALLIEGLTDDEFDVFVTAVSS
jgi:hypothetical protein